jgi:carboxyl-terminal processing protease
LAEGSAATAAARAPGAGSLTPDQGAALSILHDVFRVIRSSFLTQVEPQVLAEGALAGMLEAADPKGALASTEPFERLRRQASQVRNEEDWMKVVAQALGEAVGEGASSDRVREVALGGMRRMLSAVDPDGAIIPAELVRQRRAGIGARVRVCEGVARVTLLEEGGSAQRAGLRLGDLLTRIDGRAVGGLTAREVAELLPGAPGTVVRVGVGGRSSGEVADLEIARAEVRGLSVHKAELLHEGIGYLRLRELGPGTLQEIEEALQKLAAAGMGKLVLDLRDNGGGLLEPPIQLAMRFLERDRQVVSMRGRTRDANQEYRTSETGSLHSLGLAVLVNGGTASGAEILAAALQDHGRALLVGTRTSGRASIQTVYMLSYGNGMAMTTTKWYTPNGRSAEPGGLVPDVLVDGSSCEVVGEGPTDRALEAALKVLRESP